MVSSTECFSGFVGTSKLRTHSSDFNQLTLRLEEEEENGSLIGGTGRSYQGLKLQDPQHGRKVADHQRHHDRRVAEKELSLKRGRSVAESENKMNRAAASYKNEVMALPRSGKGVNSRYYGDT